MSDRICLSLFRGDQEWKSTYFLLIFKQRFRIAANFLFENVYPLLLCLELSVYVKDLNNMLTSRDFARSLMPELV